MRVVGLHIEQGRVSVSVVEKGLRSAELRDSWSKPFATDGELGDLLRDKARAWTGARVVSSVPAGWCSQRTLSFPFSDRKRLEKALPFELEDAVPFSLDDVVLDHVPLPRSGEEAGKKGATDVTAFLLPKTRLRRHLDLLAAAGVDPQVVVPSGIGLLAVAAMIPVEGPALVTDGVDLCVVEDGTARECRSIAATGATGALVHTVRAVEAEHGAPFSKAYLLADDDGCRAALEGLGIAVERIAVDFHGEQPADAVSLGLALCEHVNFRQGEFAYRREELAARKGRRTLIIAGAVALLLAMVNGGVKYYLVQSHYNKIEGQILAIFHQTLPEARTVEDPVRQLRVRVDEAEKKFGVYSSGVSALDVMKAVTEGIPKEIRVSFQEFDLENGHLKLQGEASSFESVDKMKNALQKSGAFADVEVPDTRLGVNNKVKFSFDIQLQQAQ